jgi:transketolase
VKFAAENMREVFGKTLVELGEKKKNLVVLDADLNTSTRAVLFREKFPRRFIQCGVAEGNMFGIAAGLASLGYIPFPCTFAAFAARKALDPVFVNICYPKLNVKISGSYASVTAAECGPTHNTAEDCIIMRSLPNMRVIDPGDNSELRSAMHGIVEYEGPVYFRVPRVEPPVLFGEDYQFEWGKGIVLKEGKDVSLIGTGMMTGICLRAAELLGKEGIGAEVIHMPSIKPIDEGLIVKTSKKTECVVTAEIGRTLGGFGSAVLEVLSREYPVFTELMGIGDHVVESAPIHDLLQAYQLTPFQVYLRAKKVLDKKRKST